MSKILIPVFCFVMLFTAAEFTSAQQKGGFSFDTAYIIANPDRTVDWSDNDGLLWVFGGAVSWYRPVLGINAELRFGYYNSRRDVFSASEFSELDINGITLSQHTFPAELVFHHSLTKRLSVQGGANLAAVTRMLRFEGTNKRDRLFSLGAGLNAGFQLHLLTLGDDTGALFFRTQLRWTEFFYTQDRGRDLDGFQNRHFTLHGGLGISFNI